MYADFELIFVTACNVSDHENKVTTWVDPRHWYDPDKPRTFAECKENELPLGWEEVDDQRFGKVFMNHITRHVQGRIQSFLQRKIAQSESTFEKSMILEPNFKWKKKKW